MEDKKITKQEHKPETQNKKIESDVFNPLNPNRKMWKYIMQKENTMKNLVVWLVVLILFTPLVYAQQKSYTILRDGQGNVNVEETQIIEKDGTTITLTTNINEGEMRADRPYMGVYYEDISIGKLRELKYPHLYGIVITSSISGTASRTAGIRANDILMQIGEEKISTYAAFGSIIDTYSAGDTTNLTIWRDGAVKDISITFGERPASKLSTAMSKKRMIKRDTNAMTSIAVGEGGGGYTPIYFSLEDIGDINSVLDSLEVANLDDEAIVLHTLAGKGNVGNGIFIGGVISWYTKDRKSNHIVQTSNGDVNVIRNLHFNTGFLGLSVDKRFSLTKRLKMEMGASVGWSRLKIEVAQVEGDNDWETIAADLDASTNNYLNLHRNYLTVQPHAAFYYRITDWIALRAEAGYMASYGIDKGWKSSRLDGDYDVKNSPDTKWNGLTLSAGPWFGF